MAENRFLSNKKPLKGIFSLFQKFKIFVNCSSAHSANSRKFAEVQLLVFVRGVMLVKNAWDLVFGEVRPSDRDTLRLCVRHSAFNSAPYNPEFKFSKNATHLYKSICHWVKFAIRTINIYAALIIGFSCLHHLKVCLVSKPP